MFLFKRKKILPYINQIENVNMFDYKNVSDEKLQKDLRSDCSIEQKYALLKEIIRRITGLSLFNTQLATAFSLQNAKIAELPTGEGKTLAAVVAAAVYALDGRKVHILVFNDYLAKRDFENNKAIFDFCGLTSAYIDQHSTSKERQKAYSCHITYVSAKEAGFDYLRDFLCMKKEDLVFPNFDVCIVDEADSILIDESKTPLVLAGEQHFDVEYAYKINDIVLKLRKTDVEIEKGEQKAWLTDEGYDYVESLLDIDLTDNKNMDISAEVQSAIEAHYLLERDKDYIIKDEAVRIIEPTTGRVVLNKRYPDLLHRAVEVKEGLRLAPQTQVYNSMSMQDFLQQYSTLCGMTGTIASSENEIYDSFEKEIDIIPPNKPCIRTDHSDLVFLTKKEHQKAVLEQVKTCNQKGQPVLMGTASVAESEEFSKLLNDIGISHVVLNAKNDEAEAGLIAQAGLPFALTISTNMAGRGVDIKLGGSDEKQREKAISAGGLYIIGTNINPCVRIDNQLRGRSGRQGDPGESRFFINISDEIFSSRLSNNQIAKAKNKPKQLQNMVRKVQDELNGEAAEARYMLQRYAFILEHQRNIVSTWRKNLLQGKENPKYLSENHNELLKKLSQKFDREGILLAEKQLTLFYINKHWSDYLATMEAARSGIHFAVLSRRSPIDEYHNIAINAYDEMMAEIEQNVIETIETIEITKDGIDIEDKMFNGGTTTWTYMVDERLYQFSRLPYLINKISQKPNKKSSNK